MSEPSDEVRVGQATQVHLAPHRRRLLLRMWALATMGLAVRALATGWLGPVERAQGVPWHRAVVDVNAAAVAELSALPGVGPVRARAIVLHRVRHGWFASLDELRGVDGIGAETIEELRPFATAGPSTAR